MSPRKSQCCYLTLSPSCDATATRATQQPIPAPVLAEGLQVFAGRSWCNLELLWQRSEL